MSVRPGFKVTEIGQIPEEWTYGSIEEFAMTSDEAVQTGPFGAQLHASDYVKHGVPLVRIVNVNDGKINTDNLVSVSQEKTSELERYRLKMGDIVFSRVGSVGRAAVVTERESGWLLSGQMLRVRLANPAIDVKFLGYIIASHWFQKALANRLVGSTRKSINTEILSNLPMVAPPLDEQRKIAAVISNTDEAIQKTDEITAKTQQLKNGLMRRLVTRGIEHSQFKQTEIGEIPQEWEVVKLGQLVTDHKAGIFKPRSEYGSGQNIVGVHDLYYHDSIDGQIFRLVKLTSEERQDYSLKEGDVIYSESSLVKDGIGKALVVTRNGEGTCFAWHTRRLTLNRQRANPFFVNHVLNSPSIRRSIIRRSTQTALTGIPVRDYFDTVLPLPTLVEQQKIATILSKIDSKLQIEGTKKGRLQTLKSGLMQILLTGKARVNVN